MRPVWLLLAAALVALVLAVVFLPDSWFGAPASPPGGTDPTSVAPPQPGQSSGGDRKPAMRQPADDLGGRRGRVVVLVQDERGVPLADCTVALGDARPVVTDAAGEAVFVVGPARLQLEVSAKDPRERTTARQRLTAVAGTELRVVVELTLLEVPDCWLRVVTAAGAPIEGAEVTAQPYGDVVGATDANGMLRVPRGQGGDFLRVGADGRAAVRAVASAGHETAVAALEVRLEDEAVLLLRAVDAEQRAVREGEVTVTAMPWSMAAAGGPAVGGPELWVGSFDVDGLCTFRGLPPGRPLFVTVVPPFELAAPGTIAWTLEPGPNDRELQLDALGEIRGRVTDAGGHPIGGARVKAVRAGGDDASSVLPDGVRGESILTGDDGGFRLGPLLPGTWLIGLEEADWTAACRRVEVPAGGTANAVLRAERALRIAGRLVGPDNRPIGMFEVHAMQAGTLVATAITEKDGSFEIGSLAPGEYEVFTELYDHRLAMLEPVRARAGSGAVLVRVVSVLGDLRGHHTAAGTGDVWWRALRRGGQEFAGGRCDLDGRFEQQRLRAGTWDVILHDQRRRVGAVHGVEIAPDQLSPDLEVQLAPGAVLRPVHPTADAFEVRSDDRLVARDGLQFGLPGDALVPPGSWTVVFSRDGVELARREVTVAAGDAVLVEG
ncbi:MAG: collagen binding domain-containing protein [Planctomycetota bacterium]